ncbi:hypothetical protein EV175_007115, partial [Coemansia sp. RSA 1933]
QQRQQRHEGGGEEGEESLGESDIESGDEAMASGTEDTYEAVDAHPTKKKSNQPQRTSVFITPAHLRNHLRLLFSNEPEIVRLLFQQRDPQMATVMEALDAKPSGLTLTRLRNVRSPVALADMFFIEALPVAPTKFRPASIMGDEVLENPHNVYLGQVLKTCVRLRDLVTPETSAQESREIARAAEEGTLFEHVVASWVQLQQAVNNVMDSSKNPTLGKNGKAADPGIRQLLEKKEGL